VTDLIFYTNPMSRGRLARWMLEETGAGYDTVVMNYGVEMKAPGYLAINPMGKVPAIVHRGEIVTENAAICAYLADTFPDAGLAPAPADRARYYRWLFFAASPLDSAIIDRALARGVPKEKAGLIGYSSFDAVIDAIEAAVTDREYIASDRFSAADLYVGGNLGFHMRFGTVPDRPTLRRYVERLEARPAFARVAELDGPMPDLKR
jgi:glutathione S-transferase